MSEPGDELELQALQRELDDAFATTRPRRGFEDELWVRMQRRAPFGMRLRHGLAGFIGGVRAVPPAAAVATLLVVALAGGILYLGAHPHVGGGASSGAPAELSQGGGRNNGTAQNPNQAGADRFGRLPSPQFGSSASPPPAVVGATATPYYGPASVTWAGTLTLTITAAPVYRYQEPSSAAADQFVSTLGAVLTGRPSGFLGEYESSDYTLKVRGTVQAPPQSPAYFIFSAPSMPPIESPGAAPADIALMFLAARGLVPQWPYTVDVQLSNGLTSVRFLRQFPADQYGPAALVDVNGDRYGLEVDLDGNRPVLASGPLPLGMDVAEYPIITADEAIAGALGEPPAMPAGTGAPAVQLTHAELVYVLVPAGDHSFYEPAFLFSGTFELNGVTYEKRILISAVQGSLLSS